MEPSGLLDKEEFLCDVEPVLFPDDGIFVRDITSEYDSEKALNQVIDIQETMAALMKRISNGKKMIQETQDKLDFFKYGHPVPREVYSQWIERVKRLRGHLAQLWTEWWGLNNQCKQMIGNKSYLWANYFKLIDEEMNPYWSTSDAEEIDNQAQLKGGAVEVMEAYLETHLREMKEYSKNFNEDPYLPRSWWNPQAFWKKEEQKEQQKSIELQEQYIMGMIQETVYELAEED